MSSISSSSFRAIAHSDRPVWRDVLLAAAPVMAASVLGQLATMPNLAPWYESLVKPAFNPPNWVFGPVWTILYLMMGYAFYRILRAPSHGTRQQAITWFLVQMALNAAWSWGFFGIQSTIGGVIVILPLLAAILVTTIYFMRTDRIAGWLMFPYIAWVSFAAVLNIAIWNLN